jgi:hypothetical protein
MKHGRIPPPEAIPYPNNASFLLSTVQLQSS